jgi:hypothetical protein
LDAQVQYWGGSGGCPHPGNGGNGSGTPGSEQRTTGNTWLRHSNCSSEGKHRAGTQATGISFQHGNIESWRIAYNEPRATTGLIRVAAATEPVFLLLGGLTPECQ